MRLCKSEISVEFNAKINNMKGDNTNIILTVFNAYDSEKDKYLFSIYLYEQKEGIKSFVLGAISYIDRYFDLTRYQSTKGLSFGDISVQRDRNLNRVFISGSPDLDSIQTGGLTLYFNDNDTMDRCYDAILECFYDAMNFCSSGKLNVVKES